VSQIGRGWMSNIAVGLFGCCLILA
jgi:hypothetical protein